MQHFSGLHVWLNGAIMLFKIVFYMLAVLAPVFGASAGLAWIMQLIIGG